VKRAALHRLFFYHYLELSQALLQVQTCHLCYNQKRFTYSPIILESIVMAAKRKDRVAKKSPRKKTSVRPATRRATDKDHTITPKERWLLITEIARSRAQKRGFIGGNPVEDWLEAEREIDVRYTTDYESIFFKTDAAEIVEQIKGVFGGHGLSQLDFDDFVDKQRGGLKTLARMNRELIDGTSEFAAEQTALLQESVRESVNTLKSLVHGELNTNGIARQAELSMNAMESVLSRVKSMASLVGKAAPKPRKLKGSTAQKAIAPAKTRTKAKSKTPAKRAVASTTKRKADTPAKRRAKTPGKRK
jgi:hypothetical protein